MDKEPDKLSKLFNLPASFTSNDNQLVPLDVNEEQAKDVDKDFEEARINILDIAAIAQAGIVDMAKIAKNLETPGAYGQLSKIIAAGILANKALMELHRDRRDATQGTAPSTINNTLIMTTAELQEKLQAIRDVANGTAKE